VQAIIYQLQHAPALLGVDVFPAYPGDEAPPAYICFTGHIEGTVDYPTVMAGRLQRDDTFTLTFGIRLQQQLDPDSTMVELGRITTAINDVFATNPGLDGLDGDVAALVTREESWGPTEVRGNGWYADAEIDVQVTARIA
jgi:hypothetical protein